MLSLASYTRQPQCCNMNYIPSSQLLSKIPPTHWFFHSNKLTHATIPSLLWQKRTGLSLSALKNEVEVEEIDNLDDDDDVDVDDFIGDEDDDDEVIMPLRNMKKWLEHKPKGFGVDKVYDTAVEDKLMEEIEQSRKAQLANINKLKNNPVNASAKNVQQDKGKVLFKIWVFVNFYYCVL